MWLVDLDYNLECDWRIELPNNKLSDNNLASELVENWSFLNQSQSRKLLFLHRSVREAIWFLIQQNSFQS